MSPELLKAVKERVERGYSDDKIREELKQVGHQPCVIEEVLQIAHGHFEPVTSIPVPTIQQVVFSGARNLVKNSLFFAYRRLDLVAVLSVPLVLFIFLEMFFSGKNEPAQMFENPAVIIVGAVLGASLLFVYVLISTSILHIVVLSSEREVSLKEGISWAQKHIWNLVWIQILVGLVLMGGFMLLIIPGIILYFYTYFAQYVYANEGLNGMQAVLRSRDLVKGNGWSLFIILSKVGIIFFALFLLFGSIAGMVSVFIPETEVTNMIANVLMQIISAFMTLVGLYIGIDLYRTLLAGERAVAKQQSATGYIILAIIGVILPTMILIAVVTSAPYLMEKMSKTHLEEISDMTAKQRALELRDQE